MLLLILSRMSIADHPNKRTQKNNVEREVCELLRPFGITEKYIGLSQLALALQILLENPEYIHAVQKRIYMEIAELFCVNWKTIERNIRTLSTVAMRTDPQHLELLAQYPLAKRPTAVQFMEIVLRSIRSKLT